MKTLRRLAAFALLLTLVVVVLRLRAPLRCGPGLPRLAGLLRQGHARPRRRAYPRRPGDTARRSGEPAQGLEGDDSPLSRGEPGPADRGHRGALLAAPQGSGAGPGWRWRSSAWWCSRACWAVDGYPAACRPSSPATSLADSRPWRCSPLAHLPAARHAARGERRRPGRDGAYRAHPAGAADRLGAG